MLQAVVLEHSLVFLGDAERLNAPLVLQLETGLGCSVLHCAEHLNDKFGVLDVAPTAAQVLILDISITDVALVLDLDELALNDEPEHLEHVADDLIRWNRLD